MILIFHYNSVAKIMILFYFRQIHALNILKYDKFFAFYNYFVILSVKIQRLTQYKEVHQGTEWSMTARCFPLFDASSMRSWMTNSLPTQKAMICGKVRGVTRRKARLNVLVSHFKAISDNGCIYDVCMQWWYIYNSDENARKEKAGGL